MFHKLNSTSSLTLMVVGKPALVHIPPPTGMECESFDFRRGKVLEVLEFDFLKCKSWKTLENSHIYEKVLEKYMHV